MPKSVFAMIAGHSGTGKTVICKHLLKMLNEFDNRPWALLDKDVACDQFTFEIMRSLTGDGNDRDSSTYRRRVRPIEYKTVRAIAGDMLRSGTSVVCCAPFGSEFFDPLQMEDMLNCLPPEVQVVQVWLYTDEQTAKKRIQGRNHPLDRYKLEHWEEYAERRGMPGRADFPELFFLDTSVEGAIEKYAASIFQHVRHFTRS